MAWVLETHATILVLVVIFVLLNCHFVKKSSITLRAPSHLRAVITDFNQKKNLFFFPLQNSALKSLYRTDQSKHQLVTPKASLRQNKSKEGDIDFICISQTAQKRWKRVQRISLDMCLQICYWSIFFHRGKICELTFAKLHFVTIDTDTCRHRDESWISKKTVI